ncbi:hypothetical protein ACVXG7_21940 [Enterobacter hormaechei]
MALITPNLPEAAALLDAPHAQNEREMKEQGNALLGDGVSRGTDERRSSR